MRWLRPALTFAFFLLLLSNARSSRAQGAPPNDRTIETQLFQQAIGPGNFITVDAPDVNGHKQLGFGLSLNYQWRPYVIYTKETGVNAYVVEHQATAELTAAMALFDRLQIGISLPFTPLLQGADHRHVGRRPPARTRAHAASVTSASRRRPSSRSPATTISTASACSAASPSRPRSWAARRWTRRSRRRLGVLPGRQELHRPHQGDRRPADRRPARRAQRRRAAARVVAELRRRRSATSCSTEGRPRTRCAIASS